MASARPCEDCENELVVSKAEEVSCAVGNDDAMCQCVIGMGTSPASVSEHQCLSSVSLTFCNMPASVDKCHLFCDIHEVFIPDSVREIGENCFFERQHLERVIFGAHSSLERIGCNAFRSTSLERFCVPDSVRELGHRCFFKTPLAFVSFGLDSSLESIGIEVFSYTHLEHVHIPCSVRVICLGSFYNCDLRTVTFGEPSSLKSIGRDAFYRSKVSRFLLHDSVVDIGSMCFGREMRELIIDTSSTLAQIGPYVMDSCHVASLFVPDQIRQIPRGFAASCKSLRLVAFGANTVLEEICDNAFAGSAIQSICIPSSVRILRMQSFKECRNLERVIFSSPSSLEIIDWILLFSGLSAFTCSVRAVIAARMFFLVIRLYANPEFFDS